MRIKEISVVAIQEWLDKRYAKDVCFAVHSNHLNLMTQIPDHLRDSGYVLFPYYAEYENGARLSLNESYLILIFYPQLVKQDLLRCIEEGVSTERIFNETETQEGIISK